MMTPEQYFKAQIAVYEIGQRAKQIDVNAFIEQATKSKEAGKVVSPKTYEKVSVMIDESIALMEVLKTFQMAFAKFEECFKSETAGGTVTRLPTKKP